MRGQVVCAGRSVRAAGFPAAVETAVVSCADLRDDSGQSLSRAVHNGPGGAGSSVRPDSRDAGHLSAASLTYGAPRSGPACRSA